MTNTNIRHPDEAPIKSLAASDVIEAIAKRNPKTPRSRIKLAGRVAAALSGAAVQMTPAEQAALLDNKERLGQLFTDVLREIMGKLDPRTAAVVRAHIEPSRTEASVGAGLGQRIDIEEGRKRIDAYARALPIEAWAGPVLGPGDLEAKLRIPRSTLNAWHHRGAVIGLLKGERKHVYPVDQFIDGRPVQGMTRLTKIIPDDRAAWLWLRQPHALFDDKTPLDRLKGGHIDEVIEAAERDFGSTRPSSSRAPPSPPSRAPARRRSRDS